MKTIYLARHAKSSWGIKTVKDFDRTLSDRGETDAIKMAEEMKRLSWLPEKIIASPAMRVKQTCKAYCQILDYSLDNIEWNSDIYEAYTVTLLHILNNLDENTSSVLLIGHNPAMEDLLLQLCGYSDVSKHQQQDGKLFTTANIAKLTSEAKWKDLVTCEVHLEKLLRPKAL